MAREMEGFRRDNKKYFGLGGTAIKGIGTETGRTMSAMKTPT